MASGWHELTDMMGDREFYVTRARVKNSDISVEGEFELPLIGVLSFEDQVFVAEFVRSHGSIKQMEKAFGVSYPTIKSRLNRIARQLQLVEIRTGPDREQILAMLDSGEISVQEAIARLKGREG